MSTELIKISLDQQGKQTVLGRDLHEGLEVETPYHKWFPRMIEYGFQEGKDYWTILSNRSDDLPGKPRTDHVLSLDMAKHVAMIQRTEKGKRFREYFIECERRFTAGETLGIHSGGMKSLSVAGQEIFVPLDRPYSYSISKTGCVTVRVQLPRPESATNRARRTAKEKGPMFPELLATTNDPLALFDRDGDIIPEKAPPPVPPIITHTHQEGHLDALSRFLNECCVAGPGCETPSLELWNAWETWCLGRKEYFISERSVFFRCLVLLFKDEEKRLKRVNRFMQPKAKCGRYWAYEGIGLTEIAKSATKIG